MKVLAMSDSLQPHGLLLTRLLCPEILQTRLLVKGSHALLQEIFPTQGSKPGSLVLQADSLPSSLQDDAQIPSINSLD